MWIVVDDGGTLSNANFLQQFQCALAGCGAGYFFVIQQWLHQLIANGHVGVEAGHGILKYHGDVAATNFAQLGLTEL